MSRRPIPLTEAVALGLLQGPAELLPVSSSGHIAALSSLDGSRRKELEVALHGGAALALLIRLRRELAALRLDVALLSLVPPVALGFTGERWIETRLGGPRSLAFGLVAGSAALVLADGRRGARLEEEALPRDGLVLGLAQACALIPGVSRLGATLAAARALGFAPADAARLARDVGVPVLVGAAALKAVRFARRGPSRAEVRGLGAGAAAAFAATLAAPSPAASGGGLAGWAAYRCVLAGVLLVRENRRG